MTEEKKVTPKKVAAKKTVDKKEEVESTAKRKVRVKVDHSAMIPCRSTIVGDLIYISDRTNAKYVWEDFGTTLWLEMRDLLDMNGSQRKYLHDGYIIVDDGEAAENLGLTKMYNEIAHIDDLDVLFDKDPQELENTVNKLPKGMKKTLATKARELIEEGNLDSISKIKALEASLRVELAEFIPK